MYHLDYSNKTPIYMQIVDQTKQALANELLSEGDQLPSVRELARTLTVNQSTIARAYKEMEVLGMISTIPGKGTFISINPKKIEWEKEKVEEKARDLLTECKFLGLCYEEVLEMIEKLQKEVELDVTSK